MIIKKTNTSPIYLYYYNDNKSDKLIDDKINAIKKRKKDYKISSYSHENRNKMMPYSNTSINRIKRNKNKKKIFSIGNLKESTNSNYNLINSENFQDLKNKIDNLSRENNHKSLSFSFKKNYNLKNRTARNFSSTQLSLDEISKYITNIKSNFDDLKSLSPKSERIIKSLNKRKSFDLSKYNNVYDIKKSSRKYSYSIKQNNSIISRLLNEEDNDFKSININKNEDKLLNRLYSYTSKTKYFDIYKENSNSDIGKIAGKENEPINIKSNYMSYLNHTNSQFEKKKNIIRNNISKSNNNISSSFRNGRVNNKNYSKFPTKELFTLFEERNNDKFIKELKKGNQQYNSRFTFGNQDSDNEFYNSPKSGNKFINNFVDKKKLLKKNSFNNNYRNNMKEKSFNSYYNQKYSSTNKKSYIINRNIIMPVNEIV
jgi:hypothetical protein